MSKKCLSSINKLLLQRPKNRPEIKASFLFNILGTIADNLRALIEFKEARKGFSLLYCL